MAGEVRARADDGWGELSMSSKISGAALGNALIWAAALLATAVLLRGSEQAGVVIVVLGGAAAGSVLLVGRELAGP